jgi:hypothetical protein
MRTCDHRYPQCRCVRFGQSRLEPLKRTALDGKVWWVIFDHFKGEHDWSRFPKRRQALAHLAIELRHGRLPYDPDPGFSKAWLMRRSLKEMVYLVDHRRLKDEKL